MSLLLVLSLRSYGQHIMTNSINISSSAKPTDSIQINLFPKKTHPDNYFYHALPYGSQSTYNPLTVLLNRGFEMLRITQESNRYNPVIPGYKVSNILKNLGNPIVGVAQYGAVDFFREQVIPFGNIDKPYWYPNYTLHLIGGGITYTTLKEWFDAHGVEHSKRYATAILIASALINESVEEKTTDYRFRLNVDAVADFWLFDIGGILLFQSDKVNKFFSTTLNMRDWSRQPIIYLQSMNLANCGQFTSLKWKLPYTKNLYFFGLVGLGGLGGLSYKFENNTAISVGLGQGPRRKNVDLLGLPIDINLVPMAGIYFDKNNSLLASLELSNSKNDLYHNYFAELNLYPGFIPLKKIEPSLWLNIARDGNFMLGVGSKYTFGMGLGVY